MPLKSKCRISLICLCIDSLRLSWPYIAQTILMRHFNITNWTTWIHCLVFTTYRDSLLFLTFLSVNNPYISLNLEGFFFLLLNVCVKYTPFYFIDNQIQYKAMLVFVLTKADLDKAIHAQWIFLTPPQLKYLYYCSLVLWHFQQILDVSVISGNDPLL